MYPYAINKLLFDLTPERLNLLREDREALVAQYRLSAEEKQALQRAVVQQRFKALADVGVMPNLLYRFARLCGYGPGEFAERMKE